ncbi:glycosyltransferase [Chloroflexi bacterium TSY]|nr:glycosyltransferase [Chloroflexi bacterium TSY]
MPPLFDALAQQTFCDFEIILVDDASTDQSVAWLEENWQKENHPDLRIIVNRRNLGFVTSVNTGLILHAGA